MIDMEIAKQSLNHIEARHRDIIKIEASIKELHDMFLDLAQLVTTQVWIIKFWKIYLIVFFCFLQGQLIDHIEHNVSKAVDFVGRAAVEVKKAEDNNIAARKVIIII
jgi:t-SNARE complex subunit (syntaxin)